VLKTKKKRISEKFELNSDVIIENSDIVLDFNLKIST